MHCQQFGASLKCRRYWVQQRAAYSMYVRWKMLRWWNYDYMNLHAIAWFFENPHNSVDHRTSSPALPCTSTVAFLVDSQSPWSSYWPLNSFAHRLHSVCAGTTRPWNFPRTRRLFSIDFLRRDNSTFLIQLIHRMRKTLNYFELLCVIRQRSQHRLKGIFECFQLTSGAALLGLLLPNDETLPHVRAIAVNNFYDSPRNRLESARDTMTF